jgi:hypothetical protein
MSHSKNKKDVATQMLIILSTSDYLLNAVLFSIVNGLKGFIDANLIAQNRCARSDTFAENSDTIETIMCNLMRLTECAEYIVKIRTLDNYRPICAQLMPSLNMLLNSIFIDLTTNYPLIAIQMSKIIQLLTLNDKFKYAE